MACQEAAYSACARPNPLRFLLRVEVSPGSYPELALCISVEVAFFTRLPQTCAHCGK